MSITIDSKNTLEDGWGHQGNRCDVFYPHAERKYFSLDGHGITERERKKIILYVGRKSVTPSKLDTTEGSIQRKRTRVSIDYILKHLDYQQPLFPRCIMTKKLGYQIEVFDIETMLWHFEASDWQDCRISAYPKLTQYKGINLVAPTLIMIDQDLANFSDDIQKLNAALKNTLRHIRELLGERSSPTILWTGNGYHIYLPIKAFVLEEEQVFAKFVTLGKPDLSTKFLRYAEQFFTKGKHDPQHKPTVNNCLLRVPGTYNSKNGQRVRVIQQWDGPSRPSIKYMLRAFRTHLIQEKLDQINFRRSKRSKSTPTVSITAKSGVIGWIELLLQTPLIDNRKYCLWRILAPYFVNVRKLPDDVSQNHLWEWLDKCNAIKKLSFDHRYRVRNDIRRAKRVGYYPIGWKDLQRENAALYDYLVGSQDIRPISTITTT